MGGLATIVVTLIRMNGSVRHSSADALWSESKSIRKDLLDRNEYLRELVDRGDARISELENQIQHLLIEQARLLEEQSKLYETIGLLKARITELESANGKTH